MARNQDDRITEGLDTYRMVARSMGFKRVPNRSDGMTKKKDWTMETSFVHGEGRVMLVHKRTAGDRDTLARRVTIFVRDAVSLADAEVELQRAMVTR